jgi:hypothetical protein
MQVPTAVASDPYAPRRDFCRPSSSITAGGSESRPKSLPGTRCQLEEIHMEPVTRRSFLVKGGVGAAGAAAVFGAGMKVSALDSEPGLTSDESEATKDGPVLVQITDAAAGKGEVLRGEQSVEFTDKALVAKVLRAGR